MMLTMLTEEAPSLAVASMLLSVGTLLPVLLLVSSDDLGNPLLSSSSLAATVVTGSGVFFKRLDKSEFWCLSSSWKE